MDENETNDRKEIKSSLILQNGTRNNLMQEKNLGGFSEVVSSKLSQMRSPNLNNLLIKPIVASD